MATYADVGIRRIQAYLARSRRLWGRRGASWELVALNERASNCLAGHPGVSLNAEAWPIDGVWSLTGDDHDLVLRAARDLAADFRGRLPGLTVQVSAISGDTYAGTLAQERDLYLTETYYPAVLEYPPACWCQECGVDAAVGRRRLSDDEDYRLCADCMRRAPDPRRGEAVVTRTHVSTATTGENRPGGEVEQEPGIGQFTSEGKLLGKINVGRTSPVRGVADFGGLAQCTWPQDDEVKRSGRRTRDNHLALVFADGNRLGGIFAAARKSAAESADGSTETIRKLSSDVKSAVEDSLVGATRAVTLDDDRYLAVVPHVVGGDDVLVSVAADRAWKFVATFLALANERLSKIGSAQSPLSISAGVVIAHAAFPFGDQVELAELALRRAKSAVAGRGCSLTWVDVTADGPHLVNERRPWLLADLDQRARILTEFANLPGAGREAIRRTIDVDDPALALSRLAQLSRRMPDVASPLADLLGAQWQDDHVSGALELLRETLSLARWWR